MINYSKKVLNHFSDPRNVGKIKNANGVGEVGNFLCGDIMKLYIKVEDDIVVDIGFETYGCAAAIATSSVITELVKNKSIPQVLKLTNQDIVKTLDGLPPVKIHCSLLSVDALSEAIYDYLKNSNKSIPKDLQKKHQRIITLAKKH